MEKIKVLNRTKEDYKDLESLLKKDNLVDENGIWFAGYDDSKHSVRHAVAANMFYGYKNLVIISISGDTIYFLSNSKEGFNVFEFAKVHEKNRVSSRRHLFYPSVEILSEHGDKYFIKVIKNKKAIKAFKKLVK